MKNIEPMILVIDGDNHGHYGIDSLLESYYDRLVFDKHSYIGKPPLPIDDYTREYRRDSRWCEYCDEVSNCIDYGQVSIKMSKGITCGLQWIEGSIWAIRPDAVLCEECDHNYYFDLDHYYPDGNYHEYVIANHYACAIINGDWSGLDDNDEQLNDWIKDKGTLMLTPVCCEHCEPGADNFVRDEITGLMADCVSVYEITEG